MSVKSFSIPVFLEVEHGKPVYVCGHAAQQVVRRPCILQVCVETQFRKMQLNPIFNNFNFDIFVIILDSSKELEQGGFEARGKVCIFLCRSPSHTSTCIF